MTIDSKKRKQLLALFLSAMMTSSLAAFAACKDPDADNDPETETEESVSKKDTARLTNGSFEFDTFSDTKLIITSPSSWSRSNASGGVTSKAASGIINTEAEAWQNLTGTSGYSYSTVDEAKANWDKLTAKEKLAFYEAQKNEEEDLGDLYQQFNIQEKDVPTCANPLTHYASTEENASKNTNVLMIHNDYNVSGKYGTAQKFASSTTITLSAGTYAKLSVWVKTADLKYSTDKQEVIKDKGAYIDVTQTIGSKTLDTLQVKNINTEVQADPDKDNGWVNYIFYLKGCSYESSTVKVTLGLGQATVSTNIAEYVSGYAFFDDVTCQIYDSKDWDDALLDHANVAQDLRFDMSSEKEKKVVNADVYYDKTNLSMDMDSYNGGFDDLVFSTDAKTELTTEESNDTVYVSADNKFLPSQTVQKANGLTIKNDKDIIGTFTYDELKNSTDSVLSKVQAKLVKNPDVFTPKSIYLIASLEGAAYTTTLRPNDSTNDNYYTLDGKSYALYSFFLKTSDLAGHTGVSVNFIEVDKFNNEYVDVNSAAISSVDTSSLTGVNLTIDTADGEETREDIYDGWQQCFFFLENDTDTAKKFRIELTYGTTNILNSRDKDYYGGYAAIANLQTRELDAEEYKYVSTNTYSKTLSLKGLEKTETNGQVFDDDSNVGGNIKTGLANPKNYMGVYGGSGFVNDTSTDTRLNENPYAGLVNRKYFEMEDVTDKEGWSNDGISGDLKAVLSGNAKKLSLGDATQPLVIYNKEKATSYGFIGANQTIASNTHATISVRVKATSGAKANIYLIDMDDSTHKSVLSWSAGVTYWYNDDGDLCAKDPSKKGFNKKTDVAFKLQDNGLYLVNEKWSGYSDKISKTQYFANLKNYEGYGEGDLLVAKGGVEYNYNNNSSIHQGNDGIAFYYKNGEYYAYSNYAEDSKVMDFSEIQDFDELIETRTSAHEKQYLQKEVTGKGDEWTTVTFYIHTGNQAKNYRLEVWSGTRDGVENEKDSLVIFDLGDSVVLTDENFSGVLDIVKESAEALDASQKTDSMNKPLESGFSFYDSNTFLRYDVNLDENKVGNSYENYLSSSYKVGTAYLHYDANDSLGVMFFVDYSHTEADVAPDVEEEEEIEDEEVETTTDSGTNIWLLASSIAIAAILLLAVVSIIVRKFIMKARKRRGYETATVQSVAPARRVKAKKTEKTVEKNEVEVKDENDPYND